MEIFIFSKQDLNENWYWYLMIKKTPSAARVESKTKQKVSDTISWQPKCILL